jgi:integrase
MPKPRSASLRVAHRKGCPNENRTALDSLDGCTCKPTYYVFHRDRDGTPVKSERVRDRQDADRDHKRIQGEIDEGRAGRRRERRTFDRWAAEHLQNMEQDRGAKGSTLRVYRSTIGYASPVFGRLELDEIGPPELRLFVRAIRARKGSDATVSKHLKQLSAILSGAVDEGFLLVNPIGRKFVRDLRLRVPRGDEPYTDPELEQLWAQMGSLNRRAPVYIYVAKAAVTTGARLGELIALDWDDVDLSGKRLHVRRTWDPVDGATAPKDNEARTVHLIPAAVAVFERWTGLVGVQPGDSPVFPAPRSRDRLNGQYVARRVDDARRRAGIPDVGEGGRKRKPFHAFRASFTRLCLEQGLDPVWVQRQLGHSSPDLTLNVYGRWQDAAMHAEADRAAPFPI